MITLSMIQELQKRLNVIRGRVDALKKNCEDYKLGMDNCDRLVVEMENATNVLFNFNIWLNERTKTRLEGITNEALSLIFPDKTMKFHVTPNQTKKGVSYELSIETDGVMTDLLDAKGGGVLDVIQICLRLTYILRLKNVTRQLVLFDEPFKNLDSERVGSAVEWLVRTADMFGIQLFIITHIPAMIIPGEHIRTYEMKLKNGVSKLETGYR